MTDKPTELGALGEPTTADYLIVLRRQLAGSLQAELGSERAQGILDMTLSILDHLIARDDVGAAAQQRSDGHRRAAAALGRHCDTAADVSVEQQIDTALAQTAGCDAAQRAPILSTLRDLVAGENDFLQQLVGTESAVGAAHKEREGAGRPTVEQIERYLARRARGGETVKVDGLGSPLGGYSKDVFVVRLSGAGRPADTVVIRRDLVGGPLESSVEQEFDLLTAMHAAGVPVAEPLWMEADPAHLGGKLLVMRFVEGTTPTDIRANVQTGSDLAPHARQLARILARVHRVPLDAIASIGPDAARPLSAQITALLDDFDNQWRRRRLAPNPLIAAGLAWMRHRLPTDDVAPVVVHGDFSLRNVLFAGDRATALLDWETWHVGDPAEDLAYCREEVEGVLPWAEFMAEYRAAGGPDVSDERLRYWSFWKYLRGAITSVSMMNAVSARDADIRTAFGGVFFTRMCLTRTAERLQALLAAEAGDA